MAHRVEDFRIFLENPEKNGAVAPPQKFFSLSSSLGERQSNPGPQGFEVV